MENVVIVGSGVAGLTAAVYAARANLKPIVIGGYEEGGQLTLTTDVENFPGFPKGIQGPTLVDNIKKQAARFGTTFKMGQVERIKKIKDGFKLVLDNGEIEASSVIVASGASARFLGIPGEKEYVGKGVSTCAICDGSFYKNKEIVVIGGGDSAMEESLFLTKFAKKVTIIHRRDTFRASKIMVDRVMKNSKINVLWNKSVNEVKGENNFISHLVLKDTLTGKENEFKLDGMFLAIGHVPNTSFVKDLITVDKFGYAVVVKDDVFTKVKGLFVAGDVADKVYRQAITAAGMGAKAAIQVEKFLES